MDVKNMLLYIGFAICGAFLSILVMSFIFGNNIGRVVKREYKAIYTVTNYKTETNYFKISKVDVMKISNIFDITNLSYIEKSNFSTVTNKLTITNILTIFEDYLGFWESPFIFFQTNDIVSVKLYKRQANYYVQPYSITKDWRVMLHYPLVATVNWKPFDPFVLGGYVGYVNSNFIIGAGIGIDF